MTKTSDRLNLKDEFEVNIKKASGVNPVKLIKREKKKKNELEVIGPLEPNPDFMQHTPGHKIVYAYDKDTFVFMGVVPAHECQIEKGVYHIPANATEIEPNKKFTFQKFDVKKQIWIEFIPPVAQPEEKPEPTKAQKEAVARAKRDSLLAASDYTQIGDAIDPVKAPAWQAYRKLLRDITDQKGFPDKIEWPEKPKK